MAGQTLIIGSRENRDSPIIVHAVRLSSVARSAEMLAHATPLPDIYTTLLDRFDQPGSQPEAGRTRPVQTNGLSEAAGGLLRGNWAWVETPQPGIALYRQLSRASKKGKQ